MADTWEVVSQRQEERLNAANTGFESVMVITFNVTNGPADGTVGVVTVPVAKYTAETVHDLIDERVAAMHEVAAL